MDDKKKNKKYTFKEGWKESGRVDNFRFKMLFLWAICLVIYSIIKHLFK